MYIVSQVLAAFGFVFTTTGRLFKQQEKNLLFNVVANIFFVFSYLFLAAYTGMMGLIISIIRSFVFYLFVKNKWEKKVWLLVLFLVLLLCSCLLSVFISKEFILIEFLLVLAKGGVYTFAAWQHNEKVFRWLSIVSCCCAIVHDLLQMGFVNAFAEFVSIIFIIVVFIRERNKKESDCLKEVESGKNTTNGVDENIESDDK